MMFPFLNPQAMAGGGMSMQPPQIPGMDPRMVQAMMMQRMGQGQPMPPQVPPQMPIPVNGPPSPQPPQAQAQQPAGLFGGAFKPGSMNPALMGLGAAIASGNPSAFAQTAMPMYMQQRQRQDEEGKRNATLEWLKTNDPEAYQLYNSGVFDNPGEAYKFSFERRNQKVEAPKTLKAADGYHYYITGPDRGKRVLPDVQAKESNGISFTTPDGSTVQIGGAPRFTELQSKQVAFAQRMKGASEIVNKLEDDGYSTPSLKDAVAREVQNPLGNYAVSDEGKKYVAAAREWISGVLRLDSGAAVPEEEFWRYFRTYFPQAGDPPEVAQQKRDMRENVERAIDAGSGGLAGKVTGALDTPQGVRQKLESMSDEELEAIINGQ